MTDFTATDLVTLLIDDSPTVLESIRTTLGVVGIATVDTSKNIGDARRRMETKRYDLVLCDYNLGHRQESGQQFLESLRAKGELSLSTIFIMVTAENSYERVVATAEIAPDDYLLKPFTPQQLLDRIFKAHQKKQHLAMLFDAIENGSAEKALAVCDTLLSVKSRYALDVLRFKAELLVGQGDDALAQETYEQVLARKVTPWAKMGMARILARNAKFEESSALLQDIVAENKVYLAAHDLLVENASAMGDDEKALELATAALKVAPGSSKRLTATAELAVKAGNVEMATSLLERAVSSDSLSASLDVMAKIRLVDVYCQSEQYSKASDLLQQAYKLSKSDAWASRCVELLMLEVSRKPNALALAITEATEWFKEPKRILEDALLVLRVSLRSGIAEATLVPLVIAISERYSYSTREIKDIELTVGAELATHAETVYRRGLQHNRTWMTQATTGQAEVALASSLAEAARTHNERTILTAAAICAKYGPTEGEQHEQVIQLLTDYVSSAPNQKRKSELIRQLKDPLSRVVV